jgi:hypothetical protein
MMELFSAVPIRRMEHAPLRIGRVGRCRLGSWKKWWVVTGGVDGEIGKQSRVALLVLVP